MCCETGETLKFVWQDEMDPRHLFSMQTKKGYSAGSFVTVFFPIGFVAQIFI